MTADPETGWVTQPSRDLAWQLEGSPVRFVIHDHGAKFAGPPDTVFRTDGMRVIRTLIAAPKANAWCTLELNTIVLDFGDPPIEEDE